MKAPGRYGAVAVAVGLAVAVARAGALAGAQAGASGLRGQAPGTDDPRVVMEVDTTVIHVGDPVSVVLRVDHPADWSVQWADSLDVAPFEVLEYTVTDAGAAPTGEADAAPGRAGSAAGGGARSVAALTITSFELGELEIPPIEIAVAGPDGAVRELATDPFRIGVVSVGLDESRDIRDIKGPLGIARNWWALVLWLLLAAALGAGAVYLYRRRRARPVAEVAKPKVPPRPFHLVALEALDELERSSLLERGRVKRWHVRVSEIIRTYVEGQLEVPALEMTTGEVVAGLRGAALGGGVTGAFHAFLARCDLVKFAKLRPGADESRELLGAARSLVRMTSGTGGGAGESVGGAAESTGGASDSARPPAGSAS